MEDLGPVADLMTADVNDLILAVGFLLRGDAIRGSPPKEEIVIEMINDRRKGAAHTDIGHHHDIAENPACISEDQYSGCHNGQTVASALALQQDPQQRQDTPCQVTLSPIVDPKSLEGRLHQFCHLFHNTNWASKRHPQAPKSVEK